MDKKILDSLTEGDTIKVTFTNAAAQEFLYLPGMLQNGFIVLTNPNDEVNVRAVAMSRQWAGVPRTFSFRLQRWSENEKKWLWDRLGQVIAKIEIEKAKESHER